MKTTPGPVQIAADSLAKAIAGLTEGEVAAFATALASDLHERAPAKLTTLQIALSEATATIQQTPDHHTTTRTQ